jgi:hypothetical protein
MLKISLAPNTIEKKSFSETNNIGTVALPTEQNFYGLTHSREDHARAVCPYSMALYVRNTALSRAP